VPVRRQAQAGWSPVLVSILHRRLGRRVEVVDAREGVRPEERKGEGCLEPCPHCGADPIFDGVLDVLSSPDGSENLVLQPCCEATGSEFAGEDWAAIASRLTGGEVQRVDEGQLLTRGREIESRPADGLIVRPLVVEVVTGPRQREVFGLINAHHRHHPAPPGWLFGAVARRGSLVVGVACAGRPVSRHLQAQGVVEITRVATFGPAALVRDAVSALYAACAREARRRRTVRVGRRELPIQALITYTLASESGASCRAAGFQCEGRAGGGSWSRPSRARTDKAPTEAKVRWRYAVKKLRESWP